MSLQNFVLILLNSLQLFTSRSRLTILVLVSIYLANMVARYFDFFLSVFLFNHCFNQILVY